MIDEDTLEDAIGMPTRAQWKTVVDSYLAGLHPTKRPKALISQTDYDMIFQTLNNINSARLGTPQFRFWARKMFQIVDAPDGSSVVTNGGRPVAIKEHIYDILCMCHTESKHGGRDKTCKVLREYYTWIPKELVASFVKVCPTCIPRRNHPGGSRIAKITELSSSRYSVERVEDFAEHPSPEKFSEQPQLLTSFSGPSFPMSRLGKHTVVDSGDSARPSASTFNSSSNESFPPCSTSVILPPLHSGNVNNAVRVDFFDSEGNRRTTLPPLLQYLSRSRDTQSEGELQYPIDEKLDEHRSIASPQTQIDPLILAEDGIAHNSRRTSAVDTRFFGRPRISTELGENALQLQLYPPTSREVASHSAPPSVDLSISQSRPGNVVAGEAADTSASNTTGGWDYRNMDSFYSGEGDYNSLLSASTASSGLPTPSASDQGLSENLRCASSLQYFAGSQSMSSMGGFHYSPDQGLPMHPIADNGYPMKMGMQQTGVAPLFSPRPLKLEDTSAMLELAAAAELDESESNS